MNKKQLEVSQQECKSMLKKLKKSYISISEDLHVSESTIEQALNNNDTEASSKVGTLNEIRQFLEKEFTSKNSNSFGMRNQLSNTEKRETLVPIASVFNHLLESVDPDGINEVEFVHNLYNENSYFIGAFSEAIFDYSTSESDEDMYRKASTIAKVEHGKEYLVLSTDRYGNGELLNAPSLSQAINLVIHDIEEVNNNKLKNFINQVHDELGYQK